MESLSKADNLQSHLFQFVVAFLYLSELVSDFVLEFKESTLETALII